MIHIEKDYIKFEHPKYKYRTIRELIGFTGIIGKPVKTEFFELFFDGAVKVYPGYAWDGCSGPTWDTKNTMFAGLLHDIGYQCLREERLIKWENYQNDLEHYRMDWEELRETIDNMFDYLLDKDDMSWVRRSYYHWGVRTFGAKHAMPERLKDA